MSKTKLALVKTESAPSVTAPQHKCGYCSGLRGYSYMIDFKNMTQRKIKCCDATPDAAAVAEYEKVSGS